MKISEKVCGWYLRDLRAVKEDIFLRNVQHINVSIDMNLEGKVRKKRIEQQFEGDKTFHEDEAHDWEMKIKEKRLAFEK